MSVPRGFGHSFVNTARLLRSARRKPMYWVNAYG
jgi:hypothetical protein